MTDPIKEYTVSEIVRSIKNTLEKEFLYIKIKGEISNLKKHPSGHFYFSLREDDSMINVVMFKQYSDYCKIDLEEGMEVVAVGKLTIYKERSNYQLLAEIVNVSGIGAILKLIQERKERLEKEGLFAAERKKIIPRLPRNAALITAETGAALQDVLARLGGRTPIDIFLYSVLMQGRDAPGEIIDALVYFNNLEPNDRPQVIVITRGGGSLEDLMAFNDEMLVRAVASSNIPIISAVGHEVDWTLIDYASDLRLPTPTSVAEYLTISREQAWINLENLTCELYSVLVRKNSKKSFRLRKIFNRFLQKRANSFIRFSYSLKSLGARIDNTIRLSVEKFKRKRSLIGGVDINKIVKSKLKNFRDRLNYSILKLENYTKRYPIVRDMDGLIIGLKKELSGDKKYVLEFPDGEAIIRIDN